MRKELTREFLESVMRKKQQQRVTLRLKENKTWQLLPDEIERLKQELDDWGYDLSDSDSTPKKTDDEAGWELWQQYKRAKYDLKTLKPKVLEWLDPDGGIEQDYLALEAILAGQVDVTWLDDPDNWEFYTKYNGQHMLWHNLLNNYREMLDQLEEIKT